MVAQSSTGVVSSMATDEISFLEVLQWSEDECRQFLEAERWPNGVACPRCGGIEPYRIERKSRTKNIVSKLFKCRECKRQFSATVGTIFEGSHVPLNKWFAAIYLLCSSKKGHSAHQIHRELGVTYKTAWFMLHRIRSAMREPGSPFLSGTVEADETYVGGKYYLSPRHKYLGSGPGRPGPKSRKATVFGMLERDGRVVTRVVPDASRASLEPLMLQHIDTEHSELMTDEYSSYRRIRDHLPHNVIRHASEYVRGEVHTNGIENYWSVLKRGLYGTYQHVDRGYLGCYLDEFAFRFNRRKVTDAQRFRSALRQSGAHGRLRWFFQSGASSDSASGSPA